MSNLPSRQEATDLLAEHVKDDYQVLHAKMVAYVLEKYSEKYDADKDLWYITGLLHDLDYFEHPDDHPLKSIDWLKDLNYPDDLVQAVAAHYWKKTDIEPKSELDCALISVDELIGFLYAYSLMRPTGYEGMKASSIKKKFKDKTFAAKVDRDEIMFGIEKLGVDFNEHVLFVAEVLKRMPKE